ncbi:MurR/RpiR family transcriptional regulator [Gracilibacillus phocaeensis]|nr:MurR/RpiR family transcriptional regulator [Gracilibacillus phocaeensis]
MNFQQRMQHYYHELSSSDKHLLRYIEEHDASMGDMSITRLSEATNVSTSTIVRCMKKLHYQGFTDFKFHFVSEKSQQFPEVLKQIKDIDSQIQTAIFKNQEEVTNTLNYLDSSIIEDALNAVRYSKKITIFGRGFSEHISKEMALKLQLLEKHCEEHNDPNIIRIKARKFTRDDLVIFVSLNGETDELVEAATFCKQNNVKTIALTTNKESSLFQLCDINLLGYKSKKSYFPDYEVRSRLPLQVLARIFLDAYVIRYN